MLNDPQDAKEVICQIIAAAGGRLEGKLRLYKAFYYAHLLLEAGPRRAHAASHWGLAPRAGHRPGSGAAAGFAARRQDQDNDEAKWAIPGIRLRIDKACGD